MPHKDDFYARPGLQVETYDARSVPGSSTVAGDVDFFVEEARHTGGPILELACGTGRVSLPLSEAGFDVVGIDSSEPMLSVALEKRRAAAEAVASRLNLRLGDMRTFDLGREFPLIICPFRAFQHLMTPEDQRSCLRQVHKHLATGGRFVVDLFDPLHDLLTFEERTDPLKREGIKLPNGNEVDLVVLHRKNDLVAQTFGETWRFRELDENGTVLREEISHIAMRWLYRLEARYLLELCGFRVLHEYSDFGKSPPAYGREQIWVATK